MGLYWRETTPDLHENGIQVGLPLRPGLGQAFARQTAAASRNMARALARLWSQVVEAYPEDAYAAATMLIYRQLHEGPWASAEKASLCVWSGRGWRGERGSVNCKRSG
ncbi:MAG TPA: hypothetical protein VK879_20130 [Candidatus Sulfomarinibacteraceae bacterium]|nr:hypothetical protein [Candidatus Sulfomarinibacteraceae bacterium]